MAIGWMTKFFPAAPDIQKAYDVSRAQFVFLTQLIQQQHQVVLGHLLANAADIEQLKSQLEEIKMDLTNLQAASDEVKQITSSVASIVTTLSTDFGKLSADIQQLLGSLGTATGLDQQKINQIVDDLNAQQTALHNAALALQQIDSSVQSTDAAVETAEQSQQPAGAASAPVPETQP